MRLNKSILSIRSYISFIYIYYIREIRSLTAVRTIHLLEITFFNVKNGKRSLLNAVSFLWMTSARRPTA